MAELRTARSAMAASERPADPHRRSPRAAGEAPRLHRRRLPDAPAPDLAAVARERAVQSRRAQGLPDHITDPATLDHVAGLLMSAGEPPPAGTPP
jgi:hypothetical protein